MDRWIVDSVPSRRYPIYTRANVGEVFPDPVTPLSATIGITMHAEPGWRDAFDRFGVVELDEYDPDNNEIIGVFGGYCYLNVSISRIVGVRTPGLTPEMIDATFFGAQPGVPPYQPQPTDERPDLTERVGATLQWILTTPDRADLMAEQEQMEALRDARPDLTTLSDAELVDRLRSLMGAHFRRLFGEHIFTTYCATVPTGILQQAAAAAGDPTMAMRLIAGVGDVESAEPAMLMWDLGRIATGSSALAGEFEAGIDGLAARISALADSGDEDAKRFVTAFDAFVHEHGCRGPNEWEMRSPTWETHPELALAAIDRMRVSPESAAPVAHLEARAAEREALGAALVEGLAEDPEAQAQVQAALHASTVFLAGRERSKTNAIRLVHECRVAMQELGRRMAERGIFEQEGEYGMLREDELDAFLADPAAMADELRRREAAYEGLGGLEPPFVFEGAPAPMAEWPQRNSREVERAVPGDVLAGIPGCPGTARGIARVITDSHDPGALEPGDVLVAEITDPSWTPLFVPAAAVVVNVGAPLSHAIIVSRELGIPCVISVTDGTRRIPDGAMVEVNGDLGTVTIL
ncbi:MAG: PEP-utilizing enzyme [Acidimicrobiales bacterium]